MSATTPDTRRHAPVAMAVALLAVGWLLLAGWGAAQYRQATHRGPVLYAPMSVAVDPADGTIFVASGAGRVHKYGQRGDGRGAFVVETGSTEVRVASAGAGQIDLAIDGEARVIRFDAGGRVVSEREDADAFARFDTAEAERRAEPTPGIVLEAGALVDRSTEGTRVLVPALPFPLSVFAIAPWTLVLSLFSSAFVLMAAFVWPFLARPDDGAVR